MKRFLVLLSAMFVSVSVFAGVVVVNQPLVNGVVVTTQSYTIDCQNTGADYISFTASFSSATVLPSIFIDGVKSTGTITLTTATGVHGSTLTIQNNSYVEGADWTYNSTYSSMSAYNLFTILNSTFGVYGSGYLTVLSTYSLTNSSVVVNGKTFKESTDWFVQPTATGTAKVLATAIGNYWSGVMLAQWSANKVNLTACVYGTGGNNALTSWVSTITVSGATMTGGKIAPLSGIVFDSSSVNALSLIRATATVVGASGNYTFTSSVSTSVVVTGMAGGVASQALYTPFYTVYSTQSYITGQSLLLTAATGSTVPTGLTANTTYFAIPYNTTSVRLASTRDNAVSGVSIAIADSTKDRGTFTLTAINLSDVTSPFGLAIKGSNDGINYFNVSATTATVYSTTTWITQYWDMGKYDYAFIRVYVTPAVNTLGSAFLKIWAYCTKISPY